MTNNIQAFNQIDEGSSEKAVLDLIQHIEDTLPRFRDSPQFVNILVKKKNENQHTVAFCAYMGNGTYSFVNQTPQKGSYTVDIGVFWGGILIFTIEAKLLPTPKGTKSSPRAEHEYVYGKGAGIQRFRDGFHGVDNQDKTLSENGLIAYIQERDFDHWLSKINQWILDAKWNESEQLKKIYFKQIAKLLSKHPREKTSEMILYHFWVNVS